MKLLSYQTTDELPGGSLGWMVTNFASIKMDVDPSQIRKFAYTGRLEGIILGGKCLLVRIPDSFYERFGKMSIGEEKASFLSCPIDSARMNAAVCKLRANLKGFPQKPVCIGCHAWEHYFVER